MSNKNGSRWIRPEKRLAIYIQDQFLCLYCGRDLRGVVASELTLDHLIPRSAEGTNEASNLVLACLRCNSQRQETPYSSYCSAGAVDRIEYQRYLPLNIPQAKEILLDRAGDDKIESER